MDFKAKWGGTRKRENTKVLVLNNRSRENKVKCGDREAGRAIEV